MKRVLLATTILVCFGATSAWAGQVPTTCTDNGTSLICDPTAFHVSAPGATGTDPVLLNNSTKFTITEVGNHDISSPVNVLFLEPAGSNTASITGVTGQMASLVTLADPLGKFSFGATSVAALGAFDTLTNAFDGPAVTISATQDLVKQIGFNGGAASISFENIKAEYQALGLTVPTTFDVFDALVPVNFTTDTDFLTVNGSFLKGTVISAIALNIDTSGNKPKIDVYDNSWTNAGFVNQLGAPVPLPGALPLFVGGLAGLGVLGRWRRRARISS
jgi:hypothetical protein